MHVGFHYGLNHPRPEAEGFRVVALFSRVGTIQVFGTSVVVSTTAERIPASKSPGSWLQRQQPYRQRTLRLNATGFHHPDRGTNTIGFCNRMSRVSGPFLNYVVTKGRGQPSRIGGLPLCMNREEIS